MDVEEQPAQVVMTQGQFDALMAAIEGNPATDKTRERPGTSEAEWKAKTADLVNRLEEQVYLARPDPTSPGYSACWEYAGCGDYDCAECSYGDDDPFDDVDTRTEVPATEPEEEDAQPGEEPGLAASREGEGGVGPEEVRRAVTTPEEESARPGEEFGLAASHEGEGGVGLEEFWQAVGILEEEDAPPGEEPGPAASHEGEGGVGLEEVRRAVASCELEVPTAQAAGAQGRRPARERWLAAGWRVPPLRPLALALTMALALPLALTLAAAGGRPPFGEAGLGGASPRPGRGRAGPAAETPGQPNRAVPRPGGGGGRGGGGVGGGRDAEERQGKGEEAGAWDSAEPATETERGARQLPTPCMDLLGDDDGEERTRAAEQGGGPEAEEPARGPGSDLAGHGDRGDPAQGAAALREEEPGGRDRHGQGDCRATGKHCYGCDGPETAEGHSTELATEAEYGPETIEGHSAEGGGSATGEVTARTAAGKTAAVRELASANTRSDPGEERGEEGGGAETAASARPDYGMERDEAGGGAPVNSGPDPKEEREEAGTGAPADTDIGARDEAKKQEARAWTTVRCSQGTRSKPDIPDTTYEQQQEEKRIEAIRRKAAPAIDPDPDPDGPGAAPSSWRCRRGTRTSRPAPRTTAVRSPPGAALALAWPWAWLWPWAPPRGPGPGLGSGPGPGAALPRRQGTEGPR
jgi:hypothetical protein